jgi:sugar lactone lactonase YvrE
VTVNSFTPDSGAAGTQVTITGSGFSGSAANDSVAVDGVLAAIVSATSTQIVFTMPPDPLSIDSALITVLIQGAIVPVGFFHYPAPAPPPPNQQNVSTFAGSGTPGAGNGKGAAASFNRPEAGVFDKQGNLYVADYGNNEIRKIDTAGNVTTYAGTGQPGFGNGSATTATFKNPSGVAIDNHGNLFVTDQGNNAIRMIDPNGNVTTVAGSGSAGAHDAPGVNATFNSPIGLGVDTLGGNLFVGDANNNEIREINLASGIVTTYAGSTTSGSTDAVIPLGNPQVASFNGPRGLTVIAQGTANSYSLYILIADYYNNKIREVYTDPTNQTEVLTLAGNRNNSAGFTNAPGSFNSPNGTAWGFAKNSNGPVEFFIADAGNHAIRYSESDPTTDIAYNMPTLTLAGTGSSGLVNGTYAQAQFNYPDGVAYNPVDGNLYVMDFSNNVIRKIIIQPE